MSKNESNIGITSHDTLEKMSMKGLKDQEKKILEQALKLAGAVKAGFKLKDEKPDVAKKRFGPSISIAKRLIGQIKGIEKPSPQMKDIQSLLVDLMTEAATEVAKL